MDLGFGSEVPLACLGGGGVSRKKNSILTLCVSLDSDKKTYSTACSSLKNNNGRDGRDEASNRHTIAANSFCIALLKRSDYGLSTVDMYVFSLPSVRYGKDKFLVLTID